MGLVIGEKDDGTIIIGNGVSKKSNGNTLAESLIEFNNVREVEGFIETLQSFVKEHKEKFRVPDVFVRAFKEVDNGNRYNPENQE